MAKKQTDADLRGMTEAELLARLTRNGKIIDSHYKRMSDLECENIMIRMHLRYGRLP